MFLKQFFKQDWKSVFIKLYFCIDPVTSLMSNTCKLCPNVQILVNYIQHIFSGVAKNFPRGFARPLRPSGYEPVGAVLVSGGESSIRSSGARGCFCWRVLRDSLLGLTTELLPDKVWTAPLILKSDSFWFRPTSLFMFWLGHCGVWLVVGLIVSKHSFMIGKAIRR